VLLGLRAPVLALVVFGGLALHLAVRVVEQAVVGRARPVTGHIAPIVSRIALAVLGIGYRVTGHPIRGQGVVVANHASWLDIFVLNAGQRITFVSKAEVAGWPGIGWLARATGTLFIKRDRAQARAQTQEFATRIAAGDHLLFFPEGTSTDGRRVLPFKTTLFAAFQDMPDLRVQPVSVTYHAPRGQDARFYGWWGDMSFGGHLIKVLGAVPQGHVTLHYHPPVRVGDYAGRKPLAAALECHVRDGLEI